MGTSRYDAQMPWLAVPMSLDCITLFTGPMWDIFPHLVCHIEHGKALEGLRSQSEHPSMFHFLQNVALRGFYCSPGTLEYFIPPSKEAHESDMAAIKSVGMDVIRFEVDAHSVYSLEMGKGKCFTRWAEPIADAHGLVVSLDRSCVLRNKNLTSVYIIACGDDGSRTTCVRECVFCAYVAIYEWLIKSVWRPRHASGFFSGRLNRTASQEQNIGNDIL